MLGRALTALALTVLAIAALGCGNEATGVVSGGDSLYDGAVPQVDSGPVDPMDSSSGEGGGDTAPAAPSTWTELYASYFGPSGVASCAGSGVCHGDMSQLGYMSSAFLCPPNDSSGCYMGVTSAASGLLEPAGPFSGTYFYTVLRKQVGTNITLSMPKTPLYTFTPSDVAKISSWVADGAKNN